MEPAIFLLGGIGALLMGVTLGLFGAGGSILTVPLFVYLFHLDPESATLYSLLVVGVVAAAGVVMGREKKPLPLSRLAVFALPAMLGMYASRNWLIPAIPSSFASPLGGEIHKGNLILTVFAAVMMAASASMLFLKVKDSGGGAQVRLGNLLFLGAAIGLLTGFVGAGGGFLIVPALVFFAGIPMKAATRSSLAVIALNSIWGFSMSPVKWGEVPIPIVGLVTGLALVGMVIGARLGSRMPGEKLKPAFGGFVLLMGSYILWRSLA